MGAFFSVNFENMITRKKVTSAQDENFEFCWNLYVDAFPQEERRPIDYHLETMAKPLFNFEVVLNNNEPIGIIAWWNLGEFRYVEHFATSPSVRGGGFGEKILRDFISESKKSLLLEVEHPEGEIEKRRIGFYERIGLVLNHHYYAHPSYNSPYDEDVTLLIMTYPNEVSEQQVQNFMTKEFPVIHFRRF